MVKNCRNLTNSLIRCCRSSVSSSLLMFFALGVVLMAVGYSVAQISDAALPAGDDWPTYMHDTFRSGCTSADLPVPLKEHWVYTPKALPDPAWGDPHSTPVEGVLEYPKVKFDETYHVATAEGAVFFGTVDNKLYCLDLATGRERWKFFALAPIRLAPTIHRRHVYFGADDGCVYCLNASDGSLVWNFRAGPDEERLLGSGRMVSMWPIRTSTPVYDDIVYFGAGVFPGERIYIYALRAEDGEVVWKNDTISDAAAGRSGFSPQGYALVNKNYLFIPSGRALPACFDRQTGQLVYQKGYSWFTYGPLGGSWALLANGEFFSGRAPIYGYQQQTGNIGFGWFPSGLQLVVTADTAYLLNPDQLVALDRQRYVKASWEHKKLSEKRETLLRSKPANLEDQLKALEAEEQRNEAERNASVKWQYEHKGLQTIIVAGDLVIVGGENEVMALDLATGRQVWGGTVDGKACGLAAASGHLLVSTDKGKIHCFGSGSSPAGAASSESASPHPLPDDKMTPLFETAADFIVNQTGIRKGYCLMLGCRTGRLAYELAKRTDLNIYAVDSDAKRVAQVREALDAAGMYGTRITVEQCDLNSVPYSDYFANLIVSEEALVSGKIPGSAKEAFRMLKPCGGVMLVGQPALPEFPTSISSTALAQWMKEGGITGYKTIQEGGCWVRLDRGPLPGAGEWTHQYGDAGNTASSDDTFLRCPLGVLWYGDPGPNTVPSRHARNAAPLSINGRVYLEGINRIICFDAYNGTILWEREIEGAYRVGTSHECSNIACDENSLFVATGPKCLRLDGRTGETLATFEPPAKTADGKTPNWTYVAVVEDLLYGNTSTKPQYCDGIFAFDINSGKLRWKHKGTNIRNNTIAISDGIVFFADDRATQEERSRVLRERAAALKAEKNLDDAAIEQELAKSDVRVAVALDAKTGAKLWEKSVDLTDCGGSSLIAMAHHGVLVFTGAFGDAHFWTEFLRGDYANRRIVALSAKDGSVLWDKRVGCRIRPLIVGDTLYAEPWAYDLRTGAQKMRTHPLTGRQTIWEMERPGHHCGCISGCPNALFFRSDSFGYYDLVADHGTEHFGGQRPGCWINMIPAGGLMIAPEASSGCVCLYSIQCTTVFKPREERKAWGIFASRGDTMPIKNLCVNLGGPGDRRGTKNKLWLAYPRPDSRLRLDVSLILNILPACGFYNEPAELVRVASSDDPWLYASGCVGLTRCSIRLAREEDGRALYTVSLGFAAPENDTPGKRVFDIKLQGQTVEQNFDIVKAGGGAKRAVVKEYKGVEVEKDLVVELVPKTTNPDKTRAPLLNTIEVARERVLNVGMAAPSFVLSDLDAQKTGKLIVANRTDDDFVGTLRVTAPDMLRVELGETQIKLAPDTSKTVDLSATVVNKGKPGQYAATVRLLRPDGKVEAERIVMIDYLGPRARIIVKALEDTYVSAGSPDADNSHSPTIAVDGGTATMGDESHNIGYLRFPINVPGKVVSVILRMHTAQPDNSQSSDSGRICLAEASWEPGKLSYFNRPRAGRQIGVLGPVERDAWIERPLDVDLEGMKELCLVLEPTSLDGASYVSTEGGLGPELIIEYLPNQ
jgi:outer membrane protein assembly factor BamB